MFFIIQKHYLEIINSIKNVVNTNVIELKILKKANTYKFNIFVEYLDQNSTSKFYPHGQRVQLRIN